MVFEHDYNKFPELTNSQLQELQFSSPHVQITEDFQAVVTKVHDGDTVTLEVDFRDFEFPLRLLDINAPELSEGGEVTREWLKEKVLNQNVEIRIDPNNRVGRYGRLLGRLFYLGMDVGQEEVYLGLAQPFDQRKEGEIPDIEYYFEVNYAS